MGNKESGGTGGGPPPARAVAQPRGGGTDVVSAISVQRDAVSNLEKKIKQLELKMDSERKIAKQCLQQKTDKKGNQEKAKRHLMNARRMQKQIEKFHGMMTNLETIQDHLEVAATSKNVVTSLAQGSAALTEIQKQLDVDKTAEIIDDMVETTGALEEAGDLLARPMNTDPEAELDVMNEMDELLREDEEEVIEEEAPVVKTKKPAPKLPNLPVAPTTKVVMKKTEEDEEDEQLNALMKEMN
jgi:charged multivesicular body protein 6